MPRFFWNGKQRPGKFRRPGGFRRRIEQVPEDERMIRSYERRFGTEEERAWKLSQERRFQQLPQDHPKGSAQS